MTDAFADYTEADDGSGDDDATTVGSESPVTASELTQQFADEVRSNLPDDDETLNDKRYQDPDGDGAADDVDPRKLFRQPSVNELRYYAREGPYGPTIIEKPLRDAFKHGFDVVGDNTAPDDGSGKIRAFLEEYIPYYLKAEKKARRDGLAVLQFLVRDPADSAADPIPASTKQEGDAEHAGFQLFTLDNLTDDLTDSTVAQHTDFGIDQIYVSEGGEHGGVALVDDISHPRHGEVLGYGVEPRQESDDIQAVEFVHADRCQHFTWNDHVDGQLGNNVTGEHVGESVITAILQPLKATQMGFWAIKNILYRYSAPLYAVEPPESWGPDDWNDAEENLGNISMSSDALLPPGSELSVADTDQEFDPQPIYEVLHEAICSGTIFTKSVLRGTQTGTVSGSETDIKGYFTEVQNLREQRIEAKFREAVQMVSQYDQETIPRVADTGGFEIDWGPLFKPSDIERAEGAVSLLTGLSAGIKQYILTPTEARSILTEEWAQFDIDVDLAELTEDDKDALDRINLREAGQGPGDNEPDQRENPRLQNGGGQEQGQTRSSSQPQRASADSLSDEVVEEIADRVVDKLQ
jgi:hypothetical protein